MSLDLRDLSVEELEELIIEAKVLIEQKRKSSIESAYAQYVQIASALGLGVDELIQAARGGKNFNRPIAKGKVEPKYRNPDNANETWTGRGRVPKWLAGEMAAGKTLDHFKIAS